MGEIKALGGVSHPFTAEAECRPYRSPSAWGGWVKERAKEGGPRSVLAAGKNRVQFGGA